MAIVDDDIRGERVFMHAEDQKPNLIPHGLAYVLALPYVQNKRVLDLCCGTGYGTKLLAEAADHVTGIDYSTTAINYAIKSHPSNTIFLADDVEGALDYISPGPEVITCMQGLEHLDNPKALVDRYKDCTWVFALPNGGEQVEHHHYSITEELIQQWFSGKARLQYFDDHGHLHDSPFDGFTNFFGVYRGEN